MIELIGVHMLCPLSKSGNTIFSNPVTSVSCCFTLSASCQMCNRSGDKQQASCYAFNSITAAAVQNHKREGASYSVQQCTVISKCRLVGEPAENCKHFLHLQYKHFTCKMCRSRSRISAFRPLHAWSFSCHRTAMHW